MRVEEYSGSKNSRWFKYTTSDEQVIEGLAGTVLCKLLNISWPEFVNEYACALYSDNKNKQDNLKIIYEKFDDDIKIVVGDILPPTTNGLKYLEKISDMLCMISDKINKRVASYDYFNFVLTNFYNYKPPLFPIQKYNISFLSFICPLIQEYCPFQKHILDFDILVSEIEKSKNLVELEDKLLQLRDLIKLEADERIEPLLIAKYNSHSKKICDLIEWYCLTCVSMNGNYMYEQNIEDLFDEEKNRTFEKEELDNLNIQTNFRLIEHICNEEAAPYKPFLIDLLYSYNDPQKSKIPKNIYYLEDIFELVSHSILYCYRENACPIIKCKYCKKYFPRQQNSQEVCEDCKHLTGAMKNSEVKRIFGVNLFGIINNIYRRLCYQGTGKDSKYSTDRYINFCENSLQSKLLVEGLKQLKNELNNEVYDICEKYKSITDDSMKEEYVQFVLEWIDKVNNYYSFALIKELLEEALKKDNPIFIIKRIRLNIIHIEESDYEIKLYE